MLSKRDSKRVSFLFNMSPSYKIYISMRERLVRY